MNLSINNSRIIFLLFFTIPFSLRGLAQHESSSDFLEEIQKGNIKAAYEMGSPKLQNAVNQEQFSLAWRQMGSSFGNLTGFDYICLEEQENFKRVFYKLDYSENPITLSIVLDENNMIAGFFIVASASCANLYNLPAYDDPQKYTEEQLSISTVDGELFFNLTIPASGFEKFVVFLPGSGPQDRDVSIGPNKIFKDLAIGLAVNGIGSVRYDKPLPMSKEKALVYTVKNEYVTPVLSLIEFLKERFPEKQVFLVGHSLGGMMAPTIASENDSIDGSVLLAANFRPLGDLITEQLQYLISINPENSNLREQLNAIRPKIAYLKDSLYAPSADRSKLPLNQTARYWRSIRKYEPGKPEVTKMIRKKPILVLSAEKDYQVPKKDFELWKETFGTADKKNKFISYPGLNHLFLKSEGKMSSPKEYVQPGHVPLQVIRDISQWLKGF